MLWARRSKFFRQHLHLNLAERGEWSDLLNTVDLPKDLSQRNDLTLGFSVASSTRSEKPTNVRSSPAARRRPR